MNPILLLAGNPSSWTGPTGNNTYLLAGRVPTLIDAGVGFAAHLQALEEALDGRPLGQVLVTHGHPDHISGAPALVARWPDVRVRRFGSGAEPISDDERIAAGDGFLVAVHTPGHSPDHCCFACGDEVFCGDLIRLNGTIVIPASKGGDLTQYLQSLHRIKALRPKRLLPGHGPAIDEPAAVIDEYVRHRAEREAQILNALNTARSVNEIVEQVYGVLPDPLRTAASESVKAHLIKLLREGKVRERPGDRFVR